MTVMYYDQNLELHTKGKKSVEDLPGSRGSDWQPILEYHLGERGWLLFLVLGTDFFYMFANAIFIWHIVGS